MSEIIDLSAEKWVTSWTGSVQGPYPIGNPSAQPDLRFAFPSPEIGARDQSFRLIVRPGLSEAVTANGFEWLGERVDEVLSQTKAAA
jgi:hypothetical protein